MEIINILELEDKLMKLTYATQEVSGVDSMNLEFEILNALANDILNNIDCSEKPFLSKMLVNFFILGQIHGENDKH